MTDPRIRDKVLDAVNQVLRDYGRNLGTRIPPALTDAAIAVHLEALEQARRIDTVADLDALPPGSVVLTAFGNAAQRAGGPNALVDGWFPSAGSRPVANQERMLPARVLYIPEEESHA